MRWQILLKREGDKGMFVEQLTLTKTMPCIAEEGSLQVHAEASASLSPILPYLNTVLKKANYDHAAGHLNFIIDNKIAVAIHGNQLVLRKIANTTAAYEMLDRMKELINDIFERKDEIVPTTEPKKVISVMDYFKLLPRTNCKKCGVPTCLAFANLLYQDEAIPEDCPVLAENKYKENLIKIKEIF